MSQTRHLKSLVRRAKKLPFEQLVRESQVARSTVHGLLAGTHTTPRVQTVARLEGAIKRIEAELEHIRTGEPTH